MSDISVRLAQCLTSSQEQVPLLLNLLVEEPPSLYVTLHTGDESAEFLRLLVELFHPSLQIRIFGPARILLDIVKLGSFQRQLRRLLRERLLRSGNEPRRSQGLCVLLVSLVRATYAGQLATRQE